MRLKPRSQDRLAEVVCVLLITANGVIVGSEDRGLANRVPWTRTTSHLTRAYRRGVAASKRPRGPDHVLRLVRRRARAAGPHRLRDGGGRLPRRADLGESRVAVRLYSAEEVLAVLFQLVGRVSAPMGDVGKRGGELCFVLAAVQLDGRRGGTSRARPYTGFVKMRGGGHTRVYCCRRCAGKTGRLADSRPLGGPLARSHTHLVVRSRGRRACVPASCVRRRADGRWPREVVGCDRDEAEGRP